ncbi:MAG: type I-B CRISPR-associated protein Cas7/Csh2, partial [Deltaproteobacteria bacterium]|nr:type I-B CRISPR-associated protein Cas7/Csh2 [Deltaproteobacteria bacterium]
MNEEQGMETLSARRELLFLYDIRMGNPNGDPDENRPRQLPDGTFYVTDVRLKRFARDYLMQKGSDILVGSVEGRTTNLTGRVQAHLTKLGKKEAKGKELVNILLDSFIDARLFGSSLAFKASKDWKAEPEPKTLTGAVQINHGEVLHAAEEIMIKGTSVFASDEAKTQGTFTEYACLRYGLMGFSGVAKLHSARLSRMTNEDYETLLGAIWNGVRAAGNTRTKMGQSPRLLVDVRYKSGVEYQIGNLANYLDLRSSTKPDSRTWSSCFDYELDVTRLLAKLDAVSDRIEVVRYDHESDLRIEPKELP